MMFKF